MKTHQKLICVTLSVTLVWTSCNVPDCAAAASDMLATPSNLPQVKLAPPLRIARMVDYFNAERASGRKGEPAKEPLVIIVQDVHAHYGAHKNIAALLDFLADKLSKGRMGEPANRRIGGKAMRDSISTSPDRPLAHSPIRPFAIAVEGAAGPIDTSLMALFPDAKVKEAAADYLMKEGELTGAEYFAIKHGYPDLLTGVEDKTFYEVHRDLFRKTLETRTALVAALTEIKSQLDRLPRNVFNKQLRRLQGIRDAYEKEEITTLQFIGLMVAESRALGIDLKKEFPLLANYNTNTDYGTMETVRASAADFLARVQNQFTPEERKNLQILAKSKGTFAYYLYLRELVYAHKLFLAVPTPLAQYMEFLHTSQTIGMNQIIHQARELAFRVMLRTAQGTNGRKGESANRRKDEPSIENVIPSSPIRPVAPSPVRPFAHSSNAAADLIQVRHDLDLLLQLTNLETSEYEVRDFAPRLNQFVALCSTLLRNMNVPEGLEERAKGRIGESALENSIPASPTRPFADSPIHRPSDPSTRSFDEATLRRLITSCIDFYVMAMVRNKPMVDNTLRLIANRRIGEPAIENGIPTSPTRPSAHSPIRPFDPSVAVLIAGGFHTLQLTHLLREKNVSYLVMSPTVETVTDADKALYVKRLKGDLLTEDEILARAMTPTQDSRTTLLAMLWPFAQKTPGHSIAVGNVLKPAICVMALLASSIAPGQNSDAETQLDRFKQTLERMLPTLPSATSNDLRNWLSSRWSNVRQTLLAGQTTVTTTPKAEAVSLNTMEHLLDMGRLTEKERADFGPDVNNEEEQTLIKEAMETLDRWFPGFSRRLIDNNTLIVFSDANGDKANAPLDETGRIPLIVLPKLNYKDKTPQEKKEQALLSVAHEARHHANRSRLQSPTNPHGMTPDQDESNCLTVNAEILQLLSDEATIGESKYKFQMEANSQRWFAEQVGRGSSKIADYVPKRDDPFIAATQTAHQHFPKNELIRYVGSSQPRKVRHGYRYTLTFEVREKRYFLEVFPYLDGLATTPLLPVEPPKKKTPTKKPASPKPIAIFFAASLAALAMSFIKRDGFHDEQKPPSPDTPRGGNATTDPFNIAPANRITQTTNEQALAMFKSGRENVPVLKGEAGPLIIPVEDIGDEGLELTLGIMDDGLRIHHVNFKWVAADSSLDKADRSWYIEEPDESLKTSPFNGTVRIGRRVTGDGAHVPTPVPLILNRISGTHAVVTLDKAKGVLIVQDGESVQKSSKYGLFVSKILPPIDTKGSDHSSKIVISILSGLFLMAMPGLTFDGSAIALMVPVNPAFVVLGALSLMGLAYAHYTGRLRLAGGATGLLSSVMNLTPATQALSKWLMKASTWLVIFNLSAAWFFLQIATQSYWPISGAATLYGASALVNGIPPLEQKLSALAAAHGINLTITSFIAKALVFPFVLDSEYIVWFVLDLLLDAATIGVQKAPGSRVNFKGVRAGLRWSITALALLGMRDMNPALPQATANTVYEQTVTREKSIRHGSETRAPPAIVTPDARLPESVLPTPITAEVLARAKTYVAERLTRHHRSQPVSPDALTHLSTEERPDGHFVVFETPDGHRYGTTVYSDHTGPVREVGVMPETPPGQFSTDGIEESPLTSGQTYRVGKWLLWAWRVVTLGRGGPEGSSTSILTSDSFDSDLGLYQSEKDWISLNVAPWFEALRFVTPEEAVRFAEEHLVTRSDIMRYRANHPESALSDEGIVALIQSTRKTGALGIAQTMQTAFAAAYSRSMKLAMGDLAGIGISIPLLSSPTHPLAHSPHRTTEMVSLADLSGLMVQSPLGTLRGITAALKAGVQAHYDYNLDQIQNRTQAVLTQIDASAVRAAARAARITTHRDYNRQQIQEGTEAELTGGYMPETNSRRGLLKLAGKTLMAGAASKIIDPMIGFAQSNTLGQDQQAIREFKDYIDRLERGDVVYIPRLTGVEASRQLRYGSGFATLYDELTAQVRKRLDAGKSVDIDGLIQMAKSILAERQATLNKRLSPYTAFFGGETWTSLAISLANGQQINAALRQRALTEAASIGAPLRQALETLINAADGEQTLAAAQKLTANWKADHVGYLRSQKVRLKLTPAINTRTKRMEIRTVVYAIDEEENGIPIGQESVSVLYGSKIDKTNLIGPQGHSPTGEPVTFISNDELETEAQNIDSTLHGGRYILRESDQLSSPQVDRWFRKTYARMTPVQIRAKIRKAWRAHELTHKALEILGIRSKLNDHFGVDAALWEKLPLKDRESVDSEVGALLAEIIATESVVETLAPSLTHLLTKRQTVSYFAARYLYKQLSASRETPYLDGSDAGTALATFEKLASDPGVIERARRLYRSHYGSAPIAYWDQHSDQLAYARDPTSDPANLTTSSAALTDQDTYEAAIVSYGLGANALRLWKLAGWLPILGKVWRARLVRRGLAALGIDPLPQGVSLETHLRTLAKEGNAQIQTLINNIWLEFAPVFEESKFTSREGADAFAIGHGGTEAQKALRREGALTIADAAQLAFKEAYLSALEHATGTAFLPGFGSMPVSLGLGQHQARSDLEGEMTLTKLVGLFVRDGNLTAIRQARAAARATRITTHRDYNRQQMQEGTEAELTATTPTRRLALQSVAATAAAIKGFGQNAPSSPNRDIAVRVPALTIQTIRRQAQSLSPNAKTIVQKFLRELEGARTQSQVIAAREQLNQSLYSLNVTSFIQFIPNGFLSADRTVTRYVATDIFFFNVDPKTIERIELDGIPVALVALTPVDERNIHAALEGFVMGQMSGIHVAGYIRSVAKHQATYIANAFRQIQQNMKFFEGERRKLKQLENKVRLKPTPQGQSELETQRAFIRFAERRLGEIKLMDFFENDLDDPVLENIAQETLRPIFEAEGEQGLQAFLEGETKDHEVLHIWLDAMGFIKDGNLRNPQVAIEFPAYVGHLAISKHPYWWLLKTGMGPLHGEETSYQRIIANRILKDIARKLAPELKLHEKAAALDPKDLVRLLKDLRNRKVTDQQLRDAARDYFKRSTGGDLYQTLKRVAGVFRKSRGVVALNQLSPSRWDTFLGRRFGIAGADGATIQLTHANTYEAAIVSYGLGANALRLWKLAGWLPILGKVWRARLVRRGLEALGIDPLPQGVSLETHLRGLAKDGNAQVQTLLNNIWLEFAPVFEESKFTSREGAKAFASAHGGNVALRREGAVAIAETAQDAFKKAYLSALGHATGTAFLPGFGSMPISLGLEQHQARSDLDGEMTLARLVGLFVRDGNLTAIRQARAAARTARITTHREYNRQQIQEGTEAELTAATPTRRASVAGVAAIAAAIKGFGQNAPPSPNRDRAVRVPALTIQTIRRQAQSLPPNAKTIVEKFLRELGNARTESQVITAREEMNQSLYSLNMTSFIQFLPAGFLSADRTVTRYAATDVFFFNVDPETIERIDLDGLPVVMVALTSIDKRNIPIALEGYVIGQMSGVEVAGYIRNIAKDHADYIASAFRGLQKNMTLLEELRSRLKQLEDKVRLHPTPQGKRELEAQRNITRYIEAMIAEIKLMTYLGEDLDDPVAEEIAKETLQPIFDAEGEQGLQTFLEGETKDHEVLHMWLEAMGYTINGDSRNPQVAAEFPAYVGHLAISKHPYWWLLKTGLGDLKDKPTSHQRIIANRIVKEITRQLAPELKLHEKTADLTPKDLMRLLKDLRERKVTDQQLRDAARDYYKRSTGGDLYKILIRIASVFQKSRGVVALNQLSPSRWDTFLGRRFGIVGAGNATIQLTHTNTYEAAIVSYGLGTNALRVWKLAGWLPILGRVWRARLVRRGLAALGIDPLPQGVSLETHLRGLAKDGNAQVQTLLNNIWLEFAPVFEESKFTSREGAKAFASAHGGNVALRREGAVAIAETAQDAFKKAYLSALGHATGTAFLPGFGSMPISLGLEQHQARSDLDGEMTLARLVGLFVRDGNLTAIRQARAAARATRISTHRDYNWQQMQEGTEAELTAATPTRRAAIPGVAAIAATIQKGFGQNTNPPARRDITISVPDETIESIRLHTYALPEKAQEIVEEYLAALKGAERASQARAAYDQMNQKLYLLHFTSRIEFTLGGLLPGDRLAAKYVATGIFFFNVDPKSTEKLDLDGHPATLVALTPIDPQNDPKVFGLDGFVLGQFNGQRVAGYITTSAKDYAELFTEAFRQINQETIFIEMVQSNLKQAKAALGPNPTAEDLKMLAMHEAMAKEALKSNGKIKLMPIMGDEGDLDDPIVEDIVRETLRPIYETQDTKGLQAFFEGETKDHEVLHLWFDIMGFAENGDPRNSRVALEFPAYLGHLAISKHPYWWILNQGRSGLQDIETSYQRIITNRILKDIARQLAPGLKLHEKTDDLDLKDLVRLLKDLRKRKVTDRQLRDAARDYYKRSTGGDLYKTLRRIAGAFRKSLGVVALNTWAPSRWDTFLGRRFGLAGAAAALAALLLVSPGATLGQTPSTMPEQQTLESILKTSDSNMALSIAGAIVNENKAREDLANNSGVTTPQLVEALGNTRWSTKVHNLLAYTLRARAEKVGDSVALDAIRNEPIFSGGFGKPDDLAKAKEAVRIARGDTPWRSTIHTIAVIILGISLLLIAVSIGHFLRKKGRQGHSSTDKALIILAALLSLGPNAIYGQSPRGPQEPSRDDTKKEQLSLDDTHDDARSLTTSVAFIALLFSGLILAYRRQRRAQEDARISHLLKTHHADKPFVLFSRENDIQIDRQAFLAMENFVLQNPQITVSNDMKSISQVHKETGSRANLRVSAQDDGSIDLQLTVIPNVADDDALPFVSHRGIVVGLKNLDTQETYALTLETDPGMGIEIDNAVIRNIPPGKYHLSVVVKEDEGDPLTHPITYVMGRMYFAGLRLMYWVAQNRTALAKLPAMGSDEERLLIQNTFSPNSRYEMFNIWFRPTGFAIGHGRGIPQTEQLVKEANSISKAMSMAFRTAAGLATETLVGATTCGTMTASIDLTPEEMARPPTLGEIVSLLVTNPRGLFQGYRAARQVHFDLHSDYNIANPNNPLTEGARKEYRGNGFDRFVTTIPLLFASVTSCYTLSLGLEPNIALAGAATLLGLFIMGFVRAVQEHGISSLRMPSLQWLREDIVVNVAILGNLGSHALLTAGLGLTDDTAPLRIGRMVLATLLNLSALWSMKDLTPADARLKRVASSPVSTGFLIAALAACQWIGSSILMPYWLGGRHSATGGVLFAFNVAILLWVGLVAYTAKKALPSWTVLALGGVFGNLSELTVRTFVQNMPALNSMFSVGDLFIEIGFAGGLMHWIRNLHHKDEQPSRPAMSKETLKIGQAASLRWIGNVVLVLLLIPLAMQGLGFENRFQFLLHWALLPLSGAVYLYVVVPLLMMALQTWGSRIAKSSLRARPNLNGLFGFPKVVIGTTEFLETQDDVLYISESLAALLHPQNPRWVRVLTLATLYLMGAPRHEVLHAQGITDEATVYNRAQTLPVSLGFTFGFLLLGFSGGVLFGFLTVFGLSAFFGWHRPSTSGATLSGKSDGLSLLTPLQVVVYMREDKMDVGIALSYDLQSNEALVWSAATQEVELLPLKSISVVSSDNEKSALSTLPVHTLQPFTKKLDSLRERKQQLGEDIKNTHAAIAAGWKEITHLDPTPEAIGAVMKLEATRWATSASKVTEIAKTYANMALTKASSFPPIETARIESQSQKRSFDKRLHPGVLGQPSVVVDWENDIELQRLYLRLIDDFGLVKDDGILAWQKKDDLQRLDDIINALKKDVLAIPSKPLPVSENQPMFLGVAISHGQADRYGDLIMAAILERFLTEPLAYQEHKPLMALTGRAYYRYAMSDPSLVYQPPNGATTRIEPIARSGGANAIHGVVSPKKAAIYGVLAAWFFESFKYLQQAHAVQLTLQLDVFTFATSVAGIFFLVHVVLQLFARDKRALPWGERITASFRYAFGNSDIALMTLVTFIGAFLIGDTQLINLSEPLKDAVIWLVSIIHFAINWKRNKGRFLAAVRNAASAERALAADGVPLPDTADLDITLSNTVGHTRQKNVQEWRRNIFNLSA